MKIYLVGGAVRDQLLGITPSEKDWLVVGASPQELLDQGYQQVGRDFPVFLHPETKDEYALARTERKIAPGHLGFECHADKNVSLEEDLARRDFTINAIAMDEHKQLYDPYHGKKDLETRILRHVSPAFSEDPLRILRGARFASQLAQWQFRFCDDTLQLMQRMCENDELETISAERIWQETHKALAAAAPQKFLEAIFKIGALEKLFPEIYPLLDNYQPLNEKNDIISCLEYAANHKLSTEIRFALLFYTRHSHATRSSNIQSLCKRLKTPNNFKQFALLCENNHRAILDSRQLDASLLVQLFDTSDAWRKPESFECLLTFCNCINAVIYKNKHADDIQKVRQALEICNTISPKPFVEKGMKGVAIRNALFTARVNAVENTNI